MQRRYRVPEEKSAWAAEDGGKRTDVEERSKRKTPVKSSTVVALLAATAAVLAMPDVTCRVMQENPGGPSGYAAAAGASGAAADTSAAERLDFPPRLSPELPSGIDRAFMLKLDLADPYDLAQASRVFDLFAWESFVALQWPVDSQGTPAPALTGPGVPRWVYWMTPNEIFLPDGARPDSTYGVLEMARSFDDEECEAAHLSKQKSLSDALERHELTLAEADGNHLWDQNGNQVYYEVFLNDIVFADILKQQLYNVEGQIRYLGDGSNAAFFGWANPNLHPPTTGSITMKLAWKEIDETKGDLPDRYFTREVCVPQEELSGVLVKKTLGLVGMHIARKLVDAPEWVWSTFEHVDNLAVNELDLSEPGRQRPSRPSFYDPACPTCPVNTPPEPDEDGIRRTQAARTIPVPEATETLNRQAQTRLREAGSVLRFYKLIGAQWPTSVWPTAPVRRTPKDQSKALTAWVLNDSLGRPAPPFLANSVMETYFQAGNQPASALQYRGPDNKTVVYGALGCMQCHSFSSIASGIGADGKVIPGPRLSGDFVFSLSRAQPAARETN